MSTLYLQYDLVCVDQLTWSVLKRRFISSHQYTKSINPFIACWGNSSFLHFKQSSILTFVFVYVIARAIHIMCSLTDYEGQVLIFSMIAPMPVCTKDV